MCGQEATRDRLRIAIGCSGQPRPLAVRARVFG
jgi:hypothetical protein